MSDAIQTEEELKREILFMPCKTKQELHDWIMVFLEHRDTGKGLDIPDCIVDEGSTCSPMDMIFEIYSHFLDNKDEEVSRILYYASRDSYKTLCEAVIEVLALLHLKINVVHLAAIQEQSINSQIYVKNFFRKEPLRKFVVGDNVKQTIVTRFYNSETGQNLTTEEYNALPPEAKPAFREITNKAEIIVATLQSTNGKHAPLLCLDEIDVLRDKKAYAESKLIPTPSQTEEGMVRLPLTVLTSTRKFSFGLVQHEIDEAHHSGLQIRHWNILDVTEACPTTRHRPDLPHLPIYRSNETLKSLSEEEYSALSPDLQQKYIKDKGFYGCLKNCKLFAMCKCRLALKQKSKSSLLRPIAHTINQFKNNSIPMAKAQLLCWKPSTEGLIYPSLERETHVLTAAQIYEHISGEPPSTPHFTKEMLLQSLKVHEIKWYGGVDFGYTHNFVVVIGFVYGNKIYITDCHAVAELEAGQQIELLENKVKKFDPAIFADPENPQMIKTMRKEGFRVKDWKKGKGTVIGGIDIVRMKLQPSIGDPQMFFLAEDDGVDLLIKRMKAYHWKLDAASKPTDVPDDELDDECDAVRYLVMNVFGKHGKIVVAEDNHVANAPTQPAYTEQSWMKEVIAEKLGEAPENEEERDNKGKKGGFIWSF